MSDALSRPRLKRSKASLFGGIATGLGVVILTLLLAGDASLPHLALAAALGIAVGAWVRLADL
jgi:hypothetical protein